MRIASWNVNGLRSIREKGFLTWLEACGADIVAVQETRARADQLDEPLRSPPGWHTSFVAAERGGYSGVAIYARRPPDSVSSSLGVRAIDVEGRVQIARFGPLTLVNAYFPNGSGVDRDNSRVPFKLRFCRRLYRALDPERRAGARILVVGDWNTAPAEIDLARPKDNAKTSGFLAEERAEIARWLRAGWVDTYRIFEREGGRYSWWSQRYGVRERNVGWRIDLALASPGLAPFVRAAAIHTDVMGSDHCPISVDID